MATNKKSKTFFLFFGFFFCGFMLLTPYTYYWSNDPYSVFLFSVFFPIVIFVQVIYLFNVTVIKLLIIDKVLILLGCYIIICSIFKHHVIGNEQLLTFIAMCFIYITTRLYNIHPDKNIFFIYSFCFFAEFIVAIIQYQNSPSAQNSFNLIKGTLGNANLLSSFMVAVMFPLLYTVKQFINPSLKLIAKTLIVIFVLVILLISHSKGAAISMFTCMIFFVDVNTIENYKKYKLSTRQFNFVKLCLLFLIIIITFSFFIKYSPSTLGREIIWDITFRQIHNNLISGIGYGRFPIEYSNWQSLFFSNFNSNLSFKSIVDINYEVFNEPLQVLIELGIVGLIIFFILVYTVFKIKTTAINKQLLHSLKISLLSILIFSLSSYPLHSTILIFLATINLAFCANLSNLIEIKIEAPLFTIKSVTLFYICISLVIISFFYSSLNSNIKWLAIKNNISNQKDLKIIGELYPNLKANGLFLYDYGEKLFFAGDYKKSIKILEESRMFYINEKTYEYLGLSHQKLMEYSDAETAYLYLTNLLPNRFRPKYLLVKLYQQIGNKYKARQVAFSILKMPVKVQSQEIDDMKFEMQSFLNNK